MFPQKNRVTTQEFPSVMNNGRRASSSHLSVVFLPNNLHFKGTVVISKKVSKLAPDRNYQKRKLREIIKKTFPVSTPNSCIFFIKKNISNLSTSVLAEEALSLSKKIK